MTSTNGGRHPIPAGAPITTDTGPVRQTRTTMPDITGPLLPLTRVLRSPLEDRSGGRLGRVDDVIVRLAEGSYPPVTGLKARVGGRELFVPADHIAALEVGRVRLSGETLNLGRFERRPGEVLLREDVLDRRLIDVGAGRLVHANDIELACVDGWWRVVGVDPSSRGILRRLLPGGVGERVASGTVVDWSDIEPFVGHVPTARLLLPLRRLKRLHPAQIADLVEGASHEEGGEIITAVHQDPDLEADVFEELDTHHQLEFLGDKTDSEVAAILAEMAPDDAADLLTELDQERRLPVLGMLPAEQQRKVRSLLSYNPTTAGGMMSPDIVSVSQNATARAALEAVRAPEELSTQVGSIVLLLDDEGHFAGAVPLADIVRAPADQPLVESVEPIHAHLDPGDGVDEVALKMTDFNLTAAPVVDDEHRVLGVVTVDDLLEAMLPTDWRRRQLADTGG